ncbi:MAG: R2-like ligand-binding oxidase, partial [Chloroflexota bacterium]
MTHSSFVTTTTGLDRKAVPMRLYEKAKKFGIWNPSHIDLSQDVEDWNNLAADERDMLLRLMAMFVGGEEAVTLDLLPLISVIANEGRLEEEMFLTTFLFEEAKHVDFFTRVMSEVCGEQSEALDRYHLPAYKTLFYEALPNSLNNLRQDSSSRAQIHASMTYNMIVEGTLAETGYHTFFTVVDQQGILPGIKEGIVKLKQDESRHVAYGLYLISRLLSADPELWSVVEERMNTLLPMALEIVSVPFTLYDPVPFGLDMNVMATYASGQFQKRFARLMQAKMSAMEAVVA